METVFYLLVLSGLLAILVLIVGYSVITGISPMPTGRRTRECLLSAVPKDQQGRIYDLGSGWGTLVLPLARMFPQCPVIGYELSPLPWLVSRFRSGLSSLPNLEIHRRDFLRVSLRDASVVVCYLYPRAMQRLMTKFEEELRPGTLVLSNTFAVPSWIPVRVIPVRGILSTNVYVYSVGAASGS